MTPTQTHKALTPAGEWVEGWFDYAYNDHPVIWFEQPSEEDSFVVVFPSTVCRATGRPDSKGKMMYNGDLVQVEEVQVDEWINGMEGYSGIYRIEYNTVDCAFLLVDDRDMITRAIRFNEMDTYTLTGKNIHDKPSVE